MVTVHKSECERTFLSWREFDAQVGRDLEKHLDEYAQKTPERKTP